MHYRPSHVVLLLLSMLSDTPRRSPTLSAPLFPLTLNLSVSRIRYPPHALRSLCLALSAHPSASPEGLRNFFCPARLHHTTLHYLSRYHYYPHNYPFIVSLLLQVKMFTASVEVQTLRPRNALCMQSFACECGVTRVMLARQKFNPYTGCGL